MALPGLVAGRFVPRPKDQGQITTVPNQDTNQKRKSKALVLQCIATHTRGPVEHVLALKYSEAHSKQMNSKPSTVRMPCPAPQCQHGQ
jgi:hypothetical protein